MTWWESSVRWYAVLLALSVGFAPYGRVLFSRFADRGASIVRPIALLSVVYPTWYAASLGLLPFSTLGLWVTLATAAAVGWGLVVHRRLVDRTWWKSLLWVELVSALMFILAIWLRGYGPEILNTEKPMEIAFLASSSRTAVMPPPDPWLAGERINYYYIGYVVHAGLIRLSGVIPTVGFNLALATTFSMTVVAMAGLAFNVARSWVSRRRAVAAGSLAAFFLTIAGNLYAPLQLLKSPRETWDAGWWDKTVGIGWRASRVVCDGDRTNNDCVRPAVETINEFPSFSFILGDLHPHVLALPFTIVAMAMAYHLMRPETRRPVVERSLSAWIAVMVAGWLVGSLYALNSWDYPTYLLLIVAGLWVGQSSITFRSRVVLLVTLVASSVVAWLPFIAQFAPPTRGASTELPAVIENLPVIPGLLTAVSPVTGSRTSTGEFLTMFGLALVVAVWLIGSGFAHLPSTNRSGISRMSIIAAAVAGVFALLIPMPLVIVCGAPLIAAISCIRNQPVVTLRTIATILFAVGLVIVLITELFFIQDVFANRMNTLFKAYYQVWTLFALAMSLGLLALWNEAWPRRIARPVLLTFIILGIAVSTIYSVVSWMRWNDYWGNRPWQGLDGAGYIGRFNADELAAIRWLQTNATDDDILLEAAGCSYQPNSLLPSNRASAYSGVSTVIGWAGHEQQWRRGQPELLSVLSPRQEDVATMFADPRSPLFDQYGITLLYLGTYERVGTYCAVGGPYPEINQPDYPGSGWTTVFTSDQVQIYRRVQAESSRRPTRFAPPL